jgi:hypothetical protein
MLPAALLLVPLVPVPSSPVITALLHESAAAPGQSAVRARKSIGCILSPSQRTVHDVE